MLSIHSSPIGPLGTMDNGGMSIYVLELSKELAKMGHKVDIYTHAPNSQSNPNPWSVTHLFPNVRLVHLNIGSRSDNKPIRLTKQNLVEFLPDLFTTLSDFIAAQGSKYDVIHSHYWISGKLGIWMQQKWDMAHVVTFHTLGIAKDKTRSDVPEPDTRITSETQITRTCHRIIVPTGQEKENLIRFYGTAPSQIAIVPCGVNLDQFIPIDKKLARKQLGMDADSRLILFVGRFAALKGIDRLIKSMVYLKDIKHVRLAIVGGDGNNSKPFQNLSALVKRLDLSDRVEFKGRIDHWDLPAYYSAADMLAVASLYESFGLVALESLACGTPVVSTPVGDAKSIIDPTLNGKITASFEESEIAASLRDVLESLPVKPSQIRSSVIKYSWANIAKSVFNEYFIAIEKLRS